MKENSKQTTKKKKLKAFRESISNNLYMIGLAFRASPSVTIGRLAGFMLRRGLMAMFFNIIFLERLMGFVETGADFRDAALFLAISLALIAILRIWDDYYWHYMEPAGNQIIYEKLHLRMFQQAADVELECFENPDFYNKYMKATSQIKGKALGALNNMGLLLAAVFNVCFLTYKSIVTDPLVLLFAVVPFIVTFVLNVKANKLSYQRYEKNVPLERKTEYVKRSMYLQEYAKEIRLSNIYNVLMDNFHEAIKNILDNIRKYGLRITLMYLLRDTLNYLFTSAVPICYAAFRLLYWEDISAADFVVLTAVIGNFSFSFMGIADRLSRFQEDSQYINDLRSFMEYKPKIAESQEGIEPNRHTDILRMENVSYTYLGQDTPTLKGINLSIEPGQKIALVGLNGAGKTTLVKLLMRLYDTTAGRITLGGKDIKEYRVRSYRNLFATVFQDYKVLSMSVAENVMMGNVQKAEREKVEEALKNSGVYEKVMTLKNGMDTTLTREFDKEGAVLSGGETQKIAIARVFVRDCDFVILDEPSSALDPVAEYKMYESMLKACQDTAIIFISHRLSSAVLADKIYLLENGEIIEEGTHHELMRQNKKYAKMFNLQAESYR